MNFLVITYAPTIKKGDEFHSYGPYVKEMDIWFENAKNVRICSPTKYSYGNLLLTPFRRTDIEVRELTEISFVGFKQKVSAIISLPLIIGKLFTAMCWADHIHLRAPGNVTLIGLILQIFFPWKKKTVKYAGNWSEYKGQPWSYRLQKWILRNTFLSRNMKVLIYGTWPNETSNILPFFTASYKAEEIAPLQKRDFDGPLRLVFVGALMQSKNPMLSVHVAEELARQGVAVELQVLGDGGLRIELERYVTEKGLSKIVHIRGNVPAEEVKSIMQRSHFLVFLSNSEGWPKAVAEAMFWGCIPLTKPVSCVPWMLDHGNRGLLASDVGISALTSLIRELMIDKVRYDAMCQSAASWSRQYTLERFQNAIRQLV